MIQLMTINISKSLIYIKRPNSVRLSKIVDQKKI